MPPPADLVALARTIALQHFLDPALVCAVVEQESAWDAHAIRYEPAFRTRYVALLGLPPTEEIARSISWGLMQVMGQVAREHGFTGQFLSALCEPAAGIAIGCTVSPPSSPRPRAGPPWRGNSRPTVQASPRPIPPRSPRVLSSFGTAAQIRITPHKSSPASQNTK